MKLFLTTDTVGGVWDYTEALARELSDGGHRVLLAVIGRPSEERLSRLPAGVEVVWREYRLEWMPDGADDVEAAAAWMRELATLWGAEVVHLNQMAYATHHFPAPTLVVVHSDVLSWFSETLGAEAPPEWGEYAGWVRRGVLAADVLVTPSRWQSDLVRRHYGRGADLVIHNGVRPPAGEPAAERAPMVLSAGRAWDDAKGMDVLDRALEILGAAAPEGHLLGALEGPQGQRFTPRRLRAHGQVERAEIDAWMARAALYAGCSRYEPFGLAPLEAALHGCALILSDIPSFRELWEDCALFFPRGDPAALAEAIAALHTDPDRRATLAAAARTRALRRYTAERFTRAYLRLYERMHQGRGAPSSAAGTP